MTKDTDEEESCWECGGRLKYLWSVANGDLCECVECGAEQLCALGGGEDEDEEEDDE